MEQTWFGSGWRPDVPRHYRPDGQPGQDFDGAVGDPEVVAEAWATWRSEVAFAEEYVAAADDLGLVGAEGHFLRDILVHMIEARPALRPRGPATRVHRRPGRAVTLESDLTPNLLPFPFDLHRLQTVQIETVQTWVKRAQKPAWRTPGRCTVSLVQFDNEYEEVYTGRPIAEVPSLTLVPRGSTACSTRSAGRSTRPAPGWQRCRRTVAPGP